MVIDEDAMAMNTRRLAIIPARGGSKRIPRKNIKLFRGRPIILRVIDQISASGQFDEIHVSTEDREINKIVSVAGFPPKFSRSSTLSGDFVPLSEVLASVVDQYQQMGVSFDTIAMIFATAVLLDKDTLTKAICQFEHGDTNVQMISVARYPVPIEWAMRKDENGMLDPIEREMLSKRSQYLREAWYETADFVLYDERSILSNDASSAKRGFEIPYIPVDIDTPTDWKRAEMMYSLQRMQER